MQRFLRASLEVVAFQWLGQPLEEWPQWAREASEGGQNGSLWRNGMHLTIDKAGGGQRVNHGDWVVKSDQGLEAVEEAEFLKNYQPLDTSGSTQTGEGLQQSGSEPDDETDSDEEDDTEVEIEEDNDDETEESESDEDGESHGTETEVSQTSDPE